MDVNEWEKWYEEILGDFGFSRDDDEKSADLLDKILEDHGCLTIDDLYDEIMYKKGRCDKAIVFGAGPSLKEHIEKLKAEYALRNYVLIAADGATTALLEEDVIPDIIVTDLDGKVSDLLTANTLGSYFVIHAHGNNEDNIDLWTTSFNKILGTTQSVPVGNLYNFGGFTDGDRAMFLACELGIGEMILAGMDFGTVVTKYSRPDIDGETGPADEVKAKKLVYAERLTNWIKENIDVEIDNLVK